MKLEKILEYLSSLIDGNLKDKKIFNYYQFMWIYALLTKLDKPLLAEISAILNDIIKVHYNANNFIYKNIRLSLVHRYDKYDFGYNK